MYILLQGLCSLHHKNDGQDSFRIAFYQTDKEKIEKGMKILKEELILAKELRYDKLN